MTNINVDLHQLSSNRLIRRLQILVLIHGLELGFLRIKEFCAIKNCAMSYVNKPLENLKGAGYFNLIEITFEVLISQI